MAKNIQWKVAVAEGHFTMGGTRIPDTTNGKKRIRSRLVKLERRHEKDGMSFLSILKTVLGEYNSPSMQFNESVDPDAPKPAPATLGRDISVNDDDVEIAQLLMLLPDQDERENAGTMGVKQQLDIDDLIVYCFNPPWGNWGGTYKGPASAMADSAQGHCRVHWDGGDKRTLPSGDRRGDNTLLNPGEWLLIRGIEQQQPVESENESENEIEPESDAAFLERVHRGGNGDWLNEFGNLSDVDSLVYDTDDEPFSTAEARRYKQLKHG